MHPSAPMADTEVKDATTVAKASGRRRRGRRVAAVTGAASMALVLGACFGPMTSAGTTIATSCTSHDKTGAVTGTFDADLTVGLSAPKWTGTDSDMPFRGASMSGTGSIQDPTILAFSVDGASPSSLQYTRNASDDGFDNVQKRHVWAEVGANVTASFASVLVIHINGSNVTYDLCTPVEGADATVITVPVVEAPPEAPAR